VTDPVFELAVLSQKKKNAPTMARHYERLELPMITSWLLRRATLQVFVAGVLLVAAGCAELDEVVRQTANGSFPASGGAASSGQLDERTVGAGLKEALRVGSGRATETTSRVDGFLANQLIRIALPDEFRKAAPTLRQLGFGPQLDQLEVSMNRAAERASGEAREIFWNAITKMTLSDAIGILKGNKTAATDYLRRHTDNELRARLHPIVVTKMKEVGVYNTYNRAADAYRRIPFAKQPTNLDQYITQKTLDGVFSTLALEEKRIREDPGARTTDLLRKVFGSRN
jgi:hypothetical protein